MSISFPLVPVDTDIVISDESTGNLDTSSGSDIMNLFQDLRDQGRTILVIIHDPALACRTPHQVKIRDGLITNDCRGKIYPVRKIQA